MNKNKKAFTLIEIIMSIAIVSIIASLGYIYKKQSDFYSAVNDMNQKLFYIIDAGTMNTITGYINATGGDCSNTYEYTDLSAGRMIDCNDWNSIYPYSGTKSTDGTESYIVSFLKEYMPSGSGCNLYLDEKDTDEFYMFLDCSNINFDSDNRRKKFIEQKVLSYMKDNFSTIYQSVDMQSTAVDNDSSGTDEDGKIRILFKK